MSVKVYGVPASQNVCGPVILAMEAKAGGMEYCNIMEGDQMKPDFLAMNPWHQVPTMKDGDLAIGESNAILRYIARKYMPEVYPAGEPEKAATIDFAMDIFANTVYKAHYGTIYVAFGFAKAPEDQKAANTQYIEASELWLKTFVGDKKFCGGESPNLADYKAVPFFFAAIQPACKKLIGLEMPQKVVDYVSEFCSKVGAAAFMESAGGYSIKEFAAMKESA